MSFVDIDTTVVQQAGSDLADVSQKILQSIQNAQDAQTAIQGYQSPERAPQIKQYLGQLLDAAPGIQQRVHQFSQFLDGVAQTYNKLG
jgi:hypothetical protein